MKFTFGTDPEFMLYRDGKIYSAIPILDAPKENKIKRDGYQFYYDNVLAECTTPATSSKKATIEMIRKCLSHFSDIVDPYKLLIRASYEYDKEEFKHPKAFEISCNPDMDAYTFMLIRPDEMTLRKTDLRSAGGHIHLGAKVLQQENKGRNATRLLDLFLAIPSLYIDKDPSSPVRRSLFGKAGRYRITAYGIEYRPLSNFWLASPALVGLVYDLCNFVLEMVNEDEDEKIWQGDQCLTYDASQLRQAVDTGNKELAAPFLDMVFSYLPKELANHLHEAISTNDNDLYQAWNLS